MMLRRVLDRELSILLPIMNLVRLNMVKPTNLPISGKFKAKDTSKEHKFNLQDIKREGQAIMGDNKS